MKKIDVILGLQWGDEGKGKIVDVLTPAYDIIARFQGGPNAGHTLEFNGNKHVLHIIPSGIFHTDTINIIGNGVVIEPVILKKELETIIPYGADPFSNLLVSRKAHLIVPTHRLLDAAYEESKGTAKIGSTLKGIGPCYTDKTARAGLRSGDIKGDFFNRKYDELKQNHIRILKSYGFNYGEYLIDGLKLQEYEERWMDSLKTFARIRFVDSEYYINEQLDSGKSVLAEGAQGTLLDIDFGSYPYVTSSHTITAGVCTGLGVAPSRIGKVMGVFKAYCTRVGSGPFSTELNDATGEKLRNVGHEYGSTTGRPRRCGWLDIPALKYALMINGVTEMIMTKADVLSGFDELSICSSYKIKDEQTLRIPFETSGTDILPVYTGLKGWKENISMISTPDEIPDMLLKFIDFITSETGIPISMISVGPDRLQTIAIQVL